MKNFTKLGYKHFYLLILFLEVFSQLSYAQLLQPGYSVVSCKPDASGVTLVIKNVRPLGGLWDVVSNRGNKNHLITTIQTWTSSQFDNYEIFPFTIGWCKTYIF